MLRYLFLLFAIFLLKVTPVFAQLTPSSEPHARLNPASGEMIIMPYIPLPGEALPVVAANAKKKTARPDRGIMSPGPNGYYAMAARRNWGTNYRLGQYGLAK